jgi:hypothetical protein
MPISDLSTLRTAYVKTDKALTVCREAQMAPHPRVYEKAYEAHQLALKAYNVEAERVFKATYSRPDMNPPSSPSSPTPPEVSTANYSRPDMNPLPSFAPRSKKAAQGNAQ